MINRAYAFFALISAVTLITAVFAVRTINRSVVSSDWVNHTHEVILETDAVLSSLRVAEGALRTFVLTTDVRDRAICREALVNLDEHLEISRALTRNEAAQADVTALEPLVVQRVAFVNAVLGAMQSGKKEAIVALLATDGGPEIIASIQHRIEKLKAAQMALLAKRDRDSYLQAQRTRWVVWAGVVIEIVLLAGVAWLIRMDVATRRELAATLQSANAQLESRVQERTNELAVTNAQLISENIERRWASQALEHQLRYNHLIVNSIGDLVLVLTKALNISRVNPAVVHHTGWEPSELINQPLTRVVRLTETAGSSVLLDPIAQALQDGRDLRDMPALIEDKLGRHIQALLTIFPMRDRDKVVGGVVVIHLSSPRSLAGA